MTDKFCKDCRWCSIDPEHTVVQEMEFARCIHPDMLPEPQKPDLVTGETDPVKYRFCSTERITNYMNLCGTDGNLWEPKPQTLVESLDIEEAVDGG